jgi:glycosyltransferase involved in cell wall biosynthesis
MAAVSVYIPVYNEVRFIEDAINSVIGEADTIIISDNASDDGTSDICQTYASKYPEIKYFRQKENIGVFKNGLFCLDKVSDEYAMPFCGHHRLTKNSIPSMLTLMDDNPEVVHVYAKYALFFDDDSNITAYSNQSKYAEDFQSDNVFIRTEAVPKCFIVGALYYGLYRTGDFKKYVFGLRPDFGTDQGLLAHLAAKGKIAADENSIFMFRYNFKQKEKVYQSKITNSTFPQKNYNPYTYIFAIVCDHYALAKELALLPNAPEHYAEDMLQVLIKRHFDPVNERFSLTNMPYMAPQRGKVKDEVFKAIQHYQRHLIARNIYRSFRKAGKYILPYGLVLKMKKRKSDI